VTVPASLTSNRLLIPIALIVPFMVSAILAIFRADFANTNAALLLVVVVVAVAAAGQRLAGVLCALSAGVWFDFFLTEPYNQFTINDRADVETTVLLLLVGVAVTELCAWGRRQASLASRQAGYLAGIYAAAEAVATTESSPTALVEKVGAELTRLLGLERCRFDYGTGLDYPRLRHDGQIVRGHEVWDVDRDGLPTDKEIELVVEAGGGFRGRFLMTAGPNSRPSQTERLVAVSLADQVGAALVEFGARG
jgi:hypothetical protein